MITIENHLGKIDMSYNYLATLIGKAATSCFGVVGMNAIGAKQGVLSFLNKNNRDEKMGVRIYQKNNKLIIDLHITVMYGVNITAIKDSITHKVKYIVEEATGLNVTKINIFIDGMNS